MHLVILLVTDMKVPCDPMLKGTSVLSTPYCFRAVVRTLLAHDKATPSVISAVLGLLPQAMACLMCCIKQSMLRYP